MLDNVKKTLWKWPFPKRTKKSFQTEYTEFKFLTSIINHSHNHNIIDWYNIEEYLQNHKKFLKDHEKYCIKRT